MKISEKKSPAINTIRIRLVSCFLFFLLILPHHLYPQLNFNGRIFSGTLFDSNIDEKPSSESSYGLNVFSSLNANYKNHWEGTWLSNNFVYKNHAVNNRTFNQIDLKCFINVSPGFKLQPYIRTEIKQYVNSNNDYQMYTGGFNTLLLLPKTVSIATDCYRTKVFFHSFPMFNNLSDRITFSLTKNLNSMEYIGGKVLAGNHRYSKTAIDTQGKDLSIRQRDNTFGAGMSMQWYIKSFLMGGNYLFSWISSNSYGSSFKIHKLDIMVLKKITTNMFVKLYASTEVKNYRENAFISEDVTIYQLGSDSKTAILEIGKSFKKRWEIKTRFQWYHNPAFLSRSYYDRKVISIGAEYILK